MNLTKRKLLKLFESPSYTPKSFDGLCMLLGIKTDDDKKKLGDLLGELEKEGIIYKTKRGRYLLSIKADILPGILEVNPKGYAFLRPSVKGYPDVFIPERELNDALDRDFVLVKFYKDKEGRLSGSVVKILSRGRSKVIGKLERISNFGFVIPQDPSYKTEVFIPPSKLKDAKDSQVVVARIIKHKRGIHLPEGEIVKALGYIEDPAIDILSVLEEYDIKPDFSMDILREAERFAQKDFLSDPGRVDLTDLFTVTIDPIDAKDFDDAVSIKKVGDVIRLWIHIADVSFYVEEDSLVDKEAQERAFTLYLVDRTVPMLPPVLSSGVCSLKEGFLRPAFTVRIDFSISDYSVIDYELFKSLIRVDKRLYYEQAQRIIDGIEDASFELVSTLRLMEETAKHLRDKRYKEGFLDFDLPECKVHLDDNKEPLRIEVVERVFAYKIIEEFMIAANRVVAEFAFSNYIPFIFRVHDFPNPDKIKEINEILRLHNIFYDLKEDITPKKVQQLLELIKGKPQERYISILLLRAMARACYDVECKGHFGLAIKEYTHFTSPIRRYPDLVIHRILSEYIKNKQSLNPIRQAELVKKLPNIAIYSSRREEMVDEIERESLKRKIIRYMRKHIGSQFDGFISGVVPSGLFVELENTAEGFVPVSLLEDDYYHYNDKNHMLVGERTGKFYRLGDPVKVELLKVDLDYKRMEFAIIEKK